MKDKRQNKLTLQPYVKFFSKGILKFRYFEKATQFEKIAYLFFGNTYAGFVTFFGHLVTKLRYFIFIYFYL